MENSSAGLKRRRFHPEASGPLRGIRVLDLSRVLVGNALTQQLADYGAEVVKVEQPGEGDGLRAIKDGQVSVFWKVFCRNKKSIVIDLKAQHGVDLLIELAGSADVVVENFRPGTLEALGLAPERLFAANPKLVLVRSAGWGATGPYRNKLGFGTLIEAFSGLAAKTGFPNSPPLLPTFGLADLVCGLNGALATLVALRSVEERGGQIIDLSILDCMAALLGPDAGAYSVTGQIPPRIGNRGAVGAPRNLYKTGDGRFIAISASTQTMFVKLARAIGREDLITDARFRANSDRVAHAEDLDEIIGAFTEAHTLKENLAFFEAREITAGPVNDIALFMSDPHVVEREILVEMEDPDLGWLPMPAPAVRFSNLSNEMRCPAPRLGQHTREVLVQWGIEAKRVEKLFGDGVVEGEG